jgi:hypothetical protein
LLCQPQTPQRGQHPGKLPQPCPQHPPLPHPHLLFSLWKLNSQGKFKSRNASGSHPSCRRKNRGDTEPHPRTPDFRLMVKKATGHWPNQLHFAALCLYFSFFNFFLLSLSLLKPPWIPGRTGLMDKHLYDKERD